MTHQSLMQKYQSRGEIGPRIPDTADAERKAVEAPLLIDNLWRQIDRWVNERVRVRATSSAFSSEYGAPADDEDSTR